jgi:hypothetical protein
VIGRAGPGAAAAAALAALLAPPDARADRPGFAGGTEQIFDGELGHVRVHYVTTSTDAVPDDDADQDGTPDYVQEVAERAETAWEDLVARGFRAPVPDGGLVPDDGGDDRFDIYLRDLELADGNFVAESCTDEPVRCAGFFAMENDLAGFGYASREEGLSVLTSHELFHAVQSAYAPDTATAWSEGTAVWNEEQTFPDQGDYERLLPYFLSRMYRPFERGGGGFGDPYPYGAAVWPTFLDERYGDGTVRRTWEACAEAGAGADFLAAAEAALGEGGVSLEAAWTEFSRWNLLTGERADPARSYQAGADFGSVELEPELAGPGAAEAAIEGLSARYLPIAAAGQGLAVTVDIDDGAVAAFYPQESQGGPLGEPVELERDGAALSAPLPPGGRGVLVLTGVRRGGLPRRAAVTVGEGAGGDGGGGGCAAAGRGGGSGAALLLAALALAHRRRRRAGDPP